MNLGAMLALGIDENYLKNQLSLLQLNQEYEIIVSAREKKGIMAKYVEVRLLGQQDGSDNEDLPVRDLAAIKRIILDSGLTPAVKNRSLKMFELLAEAESKVHGRSKDELHFHEIGAVDAIIDIVGAAICLEYLKPDRILSSRVELGGGFVKCAHGLVPVPGPAVVELLKGVPVKIGTVEFETTTPTGAVILAANVDSFADIRQFKIEKIGYGAGRRDLEIPNVLRVYYGSALPSSREDSCCKDMEESEEIMIETNLDDMSPELFEYIEKKLFEAGVLDVYKTPIIMKKGRPAVKVSVLTTKEKAAEAEDLLFRESPALGLRRYPVLKKMLPRQIIPLTTRYGTVNVKLASFHGKIIKGKPEYEDCKRLAEKNRVPLSNVYKEIDRLLAAILLDQPQSP